MKLTWQILDNDGLPIVGGAASTLVKIRRLSDGYLFDWDDSTFKNSDWVALSSAMSEIDATNIPGWYEKSVTETTWEDGKYQVITEFDNGTVKRFGSSECEVKNGIEVVLKDLSNLSIEDIIRAYWSRAVVNKTTGAFTIYKLDKTTPLVTGTVDVTDTQSERIPD